MTDHVGDFLFGVHEILPGRLYQTSMLGEWRKLIVEDKKFAIISRAFDGMTDRMTEIKKSALAHSVTLVFGHDFGFDLDVALDQFLKGSSEGSRSYLPGLKHAKHFRVGDHGVLDNLGKALIKLASWQSFQDIDIVNHERRVMNCSDQVFSGSGVHTRLPTDGTVHHGQKRGWDLHVRNSPMINRPDESRNISDHAAAEPDDKRPPIQSGGDHLIANRARLLERF